MATTADYLNQLRTDKQALVDNLNTQGVPASSNETFTTLVPKVLDIVGGGTDTGAYKVSSVQEMNALTDMDNGDLCVVYSDSGSSELPSGYTKVEYLQSSGTQYIDTGIIPYKTQTEIKFSMPVRGTGTVGQYLMAVYNSNNNRYYVALFDPNDGYFRTANRSATWTNLFYYNANIHTIIYNDTNNKVKLDGTDITTVSDLTNQGSDSLYLLATNDGGTVKQFFSGRVYYCKIIDKNNNNTLVRNMIPAVRNSDSVAGMYDTVNDVFYTNQGTGTFTTGAVVPTGIDYTIYQYSGSTWVDITDEILTSITITPTTSSQTPTVPTGYKGFSSVTVNAVTSAIDANILPENIKSGVSILGVAGNVEPDKPDQSKTVDPSTSSQTIRPDTGYELSSVTVNAVTAAIDNNIVAENIKKDVSILGVLGTLEGSVDTGAYKVSSVEEMNAIEGMSVGDYCIVEGVPEYIIPETATFTRFSGNPEDIMNGSYRDYLFMIYGNYQSNGFLSTNTATSSGSTNTLKRTDLQLTNDSITLNTENNSNAILTFDYRDNLVYIKFLDGKYIVKQQSYNSYNTTNSFSTNCISISQITYNSNTGKYSIKDSNATQILDYTSGSENRWAPQSWSNGFQLYACRMETTTVDHLVYEYRENSGWVDVTDDILVPQTTVDPSSTTQTLPIPNGYRGFKNVTVNAVPLETKTVDPSTSVQNITPNTPNVGFSNITISAVTSNIDPNIMANNIKSGVNILGVQGNFAGIDTSDANATPINIRDGRTAYVNGVKITGNLPVVTYPVDPNNPNNWDYQFVAVDTVKSVTRENIDYLMGSYQVATSSQPDSWMFEGNRKMKMGFPVNLIGSTINPNYIRKGVSIYGTIGTYEGDWGSDTGIYKVPSVAEMNNISDMEEGNVCIVTTPIVSNIPNEYTEVKYIESTGTQYIDTGIYPYKTMTELKFAYTKQSDLDGTQFRTILGAATYNLSNNPVTQAYVPIGVGGSSAYNTAFAYRMLNKTVYLGELYLKDLNTHTLVFSDENNCIRLDNSGTLNITTELSAALTEPIAVFATKSNDLGYSPNSMSSAKLFYLKFYNKLNNNELIGDFVPCVRNIDNEVGLYDRVTNTFKGNLGTGTLVAGPIPSSLSVYQYVNNAWSTASGGPSQEAEALVDEIINGSEEE